MVNIPIGPNVEEIASGREYKLDGIHAIYKSVILASTAVDGGSSILRKGLVLGLITASGKYAQYDDNASDGTEVARGILDETIDLRDTNCNAQDGYAQMMIHGYVKKTELVGIDANGATDLRTGHTASIIFDTTVT